MLKAISQVFSIPYRCSLEERGRRRRRRIRWKKLIAHVRVVALRRV
jgi:hypothetical protein